MKTAIVILSVIAVASASTAAFYSAPVAPIAAFGPTAYYRSPALDSSYVESSRVGGNFAYRTVSGHAYQTVTPLAYSAYPAAYQYPAYQYLQAPFAAPAPFYPYQPAYFEQPAGLKPIDSMPARPEPAKETEGRQIDDDTVAVESA